jgi:hypothetical protein
VLFWECAFLEEAHHSGLSRGNSGLFLPVDLPADFKLTPLFLQELVRACQLVEQGDNGESLLSKASDGEAGEQTHQP